MSKLTYKVSYYVLYAMFAAILVVLGLFYFGGQDPNPINAEMAQPLYTDALLYLAYGLLGLAVVVTGVAFLLQFGSALKDSPLAAIKSLIGVILLVAVLVVSWSMGNEEALQLQGYDGGENVPFWLKLTDMFLYSTYFLLTVAVLAIVASGVRKKFL